MGQVSRLGRMFMILIAVITWLGLAAQFYVIRNRWDLNDWNIFQIIPFFFQYFTIVTNTLVAITLTVSLFTPQSGLGKFFSRTDVRSAIAVYIGMVGLIFFNASDNLAKGITQVVVPLLYVIFWLVFVPKGELDWKKPIYWLIYPLVYLLWACLFGAIAGRTSYSFLDVGALGYTAVIRNFSIILVALFVVGEIFVGIDKLIGIKTRHLHPLPPL